MGDMLVRGLPDDEVAELKAAAASTGQSLQSYLRDDVVHAHVLYLRRLRAIATSSERLEGRRPLPDSSRESALNAAAEELEGSR